MVKTREKRVNIWSPETGYKPSVYWELCIKAFLYFYQCCTSELTALRSPVIITASPLLRVGLSLWFAFQEFINVLGRKC